MSLAFQTVESKRLAPGQAIERGDATCRQGEVHMIWFDEKKKPGSSSPWWPASRMEALLAVFVAMQTFFVLATEDRFAVLLWWHPEAWPVTVALWLKDLGAAAASGFVAVVLLRGTIRAERQTVGGRSTGTLSALTAAFVITLGVISRFFALDQIPPGIFADTVLYALPLLREPGGGWMAGARLVEGPGYGGFAVSPILLLFPRVILGMAGAGELGIRELSAVSGLVLIAATAFLAFEVGGPRSALLTASLVALGRWPLIISHWTWAEPLTVSCLAVGAGAGLAAFRRRSRILGFVAGTAVGLAMHGHSSGLVVGAFLFLAASIHAVRHVGSRRVVLVATVPAGFLLAGWIALHLLRTGEVGGRYAQVGFWTRSGRAELADIPPPLRIPAALAFNVRAYTGLILWTGDPNPRMGLPDEPVLSSILGIAALLGFALYVRDARRGDLPGATLSVLALGALASGVFANPDGAPNSLRACGLIPVVFICGARSLLAWGELLVSLGVRRGIQFAALGALLVVSDVVPALASWPARHDVRTSFFASETEAARLRRALGPGETILDPEAISHPAVFEVVACGSALRSPLLRLPMRPPASLSTEGGADRFWYVTTHEGIRALRSAGFRTSRPAGAGDPVVVLVAARNSLPGD
jgi:hypothetical protein